MNQTVGEQIGSKFGVAQQVDVDESGVGWSTYLNVKVLINITKPLSSGRTLVIQGKSACMQKRDVTSLLSLLYIVLVLGINMVCD